MKDVVYDYEAEEKTAGEKFSDAMQSAKDGLISFGSTVAEKSKEMMDVASLKNEVHKMEKENKKRFSELGHMAYAAHGEFTSEMKKMVKTIRHDEKEIIRMSEDIEQIRDAGEE